MIGRLLCILFGHLPSVLVGERDWSIPQSEGPALAGHTRLFVCPRCRRVWRVSWVDHE